MEAGAGLVGAFARKGLVDEYQLFVAAPSSAPTPAHCWTGRWQMSEAPRLKITEMRAVGDDWRVTAIPCRRPAYNAGLAPCKPFLRKTPCSPASSNPSAPSAA
ncbi:hypothetical protein [Pseudomonas peli]|uniref:hypothetical protein n=1 Tax=Pseudomonas peli TaxID=592361 RepID=UPI003D15BA23